MPLTRLMFSFLFIRWKETVGKGYLAPLVTSSELDDRKVSAMSAANCASLASPKKDAYDRDSLPVPSAGHAVPR